MELKRAKVLLLLWLIVVSAALTTGRILLVRLHYLILALLILSLAWTWLNIRGIQIVRQTRARRAHVGQLAEERFGVRNTTWMPKLWIEVRDGSNLPDHWASRVVNSLAPGRQRGWIVRTYCRRRGRFTLGPLTLISGDPLGLWRFERHIPTTSTIVVYPATFDLPGFEPPVGRLSGGDALHRRTHFVTTNVSGVREYAPGDSFNRIHWPTTARTGRMMVKQFELDPTADVWILLDMEKAVQAGGPAEDEGENLGLVPAPLWVPHLKLSIDPSTEEYGVTIAASIARHFLNEKRAVGFIAHGQDREVVQLDRGERQIAKILETLAVIRAQGRAALEHVITSEGRAFGRNTTVIAITSSTSEIWVDALRDLKRRGVRTVAVVLEASTFGEAPGVLGVITALAASNIPSYLVKCGDDIPVALTYRMNNSKYQ
ncbi:MAG: hypothetical protein A2Z04_02070 [Chloroflexi bacterium RBG_16_57_9]|nr:MAG: hypothetical protein A2Z04_02070 [Chloroflexi bacterium RBG_16_57_9]